MDRRFDEHGNATPIHAAGAHAAAGVRCLHVSQAFVIDDELVKTLALERLPGHFCPDEPRQCLSLAFLSSATAIAHAKVRIYAVRTNEIFSICINGLLKIVCERLCDNAAGYAAVPSKILMWREYRLHLPAGARTPHPKGPFMTTIVVVKKDGQVVIAGDTLTTFGSTRLARRARRRAGKIAETRQHLFRHRRQRGLSWSGNLLKKHPEFSFNGREEIYESFRKIHPILKEEAFLTPRKRTTIPTNLLN